MNDDYIIEKVEKHSEDENSEKVEYRSVWMGKGGLSFKTKLKLWALLIAGITIGTLLFLFFVTAFIYLFIPVVIVLTLWNFFSRKR